MRTKIWTSPTGATRIDELDEQIVKLLNERAAAPSPSAKSSARPRAAIYEPHREQQVIEHARKVNPGPLAGEQVQDIYERIMDVMRSLQRPDHGVHAAQQHVSGSKS